MMMQLKTGAPILLFRSPPLHLEKSSLFLLALFLFSTYTNTLFLLHEVKFGMKAVCAGHVYGNDVEHTLGGGTCKKPSCLVLRTGSAGPPKGNGGRQKRGCVNKEMVGQRDT